MLIQQLERQVGELNRSVQSLTNEKKSHETIIFQLQQDLKSVQDKKQLAEEERNRAQGDTARLRDQVSYIISYRTLMDRAQNGQRSDEIPYNQKIWRGIKIWQFGSLYYNRQIKIRQNFLLAYNMCMAIPYRTTKFKSANILKIAILGSTTKFNSRQYFRLYGIHGGRRIDV